MMQRDFQSAAPGDRLDDLVEQRLLRSSQRGFPVQEGSEFVGIVCLDDLRRVPRERWGETRVAEVMTRTADLTLVGPDEPAVDAMEVLARRDVNQLPVVQNGRLLGLVTRDDVLKWLALHEDRGRTTGA
jgi:CBS domain-containing protein